MSVKSDMRLRDKSALDSFINALVEQKGLPGAAVSVYGPHGTVFEGGYGFRDFERSLKPDRDTIFGIASMGKSMAALAVAILAAEGKLSLDDPVSDYIPSFRVPGNPPDTVTLRHLAMHTTGIPPIEPLEWSIAMNTPGKDTEWTRKMKASAPGPMSTIEEIIDYIANCPYPTLGAAGEYMSYSNEGYAILCYVVDMAAGMSLEDFLEERVFTPLGMNRTVLDIDGSKARERASDGNITMLFEKEEDGSLSCDDVWSVLPPFRACAVVKSTAHDMARYYSCLASGGMLDGARLIPAEAVELMVGSSFPEQVKPCYCLGLNKRTEGGHVFLEHSGGLHGVSSEGGALKGEGYGFAVLTNQGEADATEILWALYNFVLGLPPDTRHRWLFPANRDFSAPLALIGTYDCHEGELQTLRVFEEGGRLRADKDGTILNLVHCGEAWFILADESGEYAGRVHFLIRDMLAWGAQVYTRIYRRVK